MVAGVVALVVAGVVVAHAKPLTNAAASQKNAMVTAIVEW